MTSEGAKPDGAQKPAQDQEDEGRLDLPDPTITAERIELPDPTRNTPRFRVSIRGLFKRTKKDDA